MQIKQQGTILRKHPGFRAVKPVFQVLRKLGFSAFFGFREPEFEFLFVGTSSLPTEVLDLTKSCNLVMCIGELLTNFPIIE
jgi:hypothetical protein